LSILDPCSLVVVDVGVHLVTPRAMDHLHVVVVDRITRRVVVVVVVAAAGDVCSNRLAACDAALDTRFVNDKVFMETAYEVRNR
jgi:hypothetical protein